MAKAAWRSNRRRRTRSDRPRALRRPGSRASSARVLVRRAQQARMDREVDESEGGQAALARAQDLARAAQPEVGFGDLEAVVGRPHDREALAPRVAERLAVEQEAGRGPVAPADP